jgi:hypothetical protein
MAEKHASDPKSGGDRASGAKKPCQTPNEFSEFERLISHEYNADYEETDLFPGEEDAPARGGYNIAVGQRPSAKPLRPGEVRSVRIPLTIESPGGGSEAYELGLSISLRKASGVPQDAAAAKAGGEEPQEDEIDLLDGRTTHIFGDQDEDDEEDSEPPADAPGGWFSRLFSFWR